jgi:phosphoglycolate phosphatase
MTTKPFDLIVFDWDGTLMDSEVHIVSSMERAIADLKLPALSRESLSNVIGLGLTEAIARLLPAEGPQTRQSMVDRYRHHYFDQDSSEPFAGAKEVLQELTRQGYLLGLATGKGRRGLDMVLQSTGFGDYFHLTRCADETRSKPHPQMLLEIMEILDVAPEATLMVGDTEYDLQMAHSAGAASLAVDYGVHARDRLLQCGPLGCLDDIQRLPEWLARHSLTTSNIGAELA